MAKGPFEEKLLGELSSCYRTNMVRGHKLSKAKKCLEDMMMAEKKKC